MQKHLLFKQFVTWACNSCSTAPLSDYMNNPVYQELIDETDYNGDARDDRVYLDLRAKLDIQMKWKKKKKRL